MRFTMRPSMSGSLCGSCREAQIVELSNGRQHTICHAGDAAQPIPVHRPVVRCNKYDDRRLPSQWAMEQVAWSVRTDNSGKVVGFAPPKDKA